jgi:acetate kinase
MGFTPTAGLVMGSRCGDLDPAVPLWLVEHGGLAVREVAGALDHASGLAGLAGSADMREVLAAEGAGRPDAVLAVQVWLHRLRGGVAAMAAALGGLDVLAFSGGIGEHAAGLRARAVAGLGFLGPALDTSANAAAGPGADVDVSAAGAAARTVVVHAREDLVIAAQVRRLLADG